MAEPPSSGPGLSGSTDYDLLDRLAEEFARRYRRGERPSLEEYTRRYPAMAEAIRGLFPALVQIEKAEDDLRDQADSGGAARAEPPPLGRVGDFEIIRQIGRGGMGVVYEAQQASLGRRVALKVLARRAPGDDTARERFRREARAAAQLHHTNIVPVFEVGQQGDVCYYAMQFIRGQGLDQVIAELRRMRTERRVGEETEPRADTTARPGDDGPLVPRGASGAGRAGRVARSLLTGWFEPAGVGPEGTDTPPAPSPSRTGPTVVAPTEAQGPPAVAPDGAAVDGPRPIPPPGPGPAAVLPGGTPISGSDPGRRPYHLGVARIGRQAAEALAYAHERGIIHRDIKPSNLLLDTAGIVWVTDFGLAKGGDDGLTQTGDVVGTIRYMAPERFRGGGDARVDTYALGLTLYELMVLRPAFESPDRLELIERIKTAEPPRPRALDPRVPRDLETIVLKAIEKDPDRRYPTAAAMARHLQSFLDGRPVAARPIGTAERAWRWCRRRPAVAALSATVALAVGGGAAATIAVQYAANRRLDAKNLDLDRANAGLREAIGQKDAANLGLAEANARVQERFDLAREAIRSLKRGVEEEEALKEDRLRPLRDKLLGAARRFYDRLGELLRGQDDAGSKAVLAESYAELGELIDRVGQRPEAREAYRKAVAIRRELAAAPGAGLTERVELARALNALGEEALELGDHAGALAAYKEARALAELLAAGSGATLAARRELGSAFHGTGMALATTGADGRAMAAFRRAREVREPLARDAGAVPEDRRDLASSHAWVGALLDKTGDRAGALAEQRRSQGLMGALAAEHPAVPDYRRGLANGHAWAGVLLAKAGDTAGALAEHRAALELQRALAAEHPAVPDYRRDLALSHSQVGGLLERTGDLAGALAEHRAALELRRALAAEHPAVPDYRRGLAISHNRVGGLLEALGDLAGALAEQRRFRELMGALAAEHPAVPDYRRGLAISHNRVGALLALAGRPAEALDEVERARSLLEALAHAGPNVPDYGDSLAAALNCAGDALRDLSRGDEAPTAWAGPPPWPRPWLRRARRRRPTGLAWPRP